VFIIAYLQISKPQFKSAFTNVKASAKTRLINKGKFTILILFCQGISADLWVLKGLALPFPQFG
jgi:hypothetical protein